MELSEFGKNNGQPEDDLTPEEQYAKGMEEEKNGYYSNALAWFEKAANQGHVDAQLECGWMYSEGEGAAADMAKSLMWYKKVTEQYYVFSEPSDHGHIKNYRYMCRVQDIPRFLKWSEKIAAQGHTQAQFDCGWMYNQGTGTAKDSAKALMWYERAAAQGYAPAQFECGRMYYQGTGTEMDKTKALMWFEKAAKQNHARAQFECGWMYDHGEGTVTDKAKALMWFETVAERMNYAPDQFECGWRHHKGIGTAANNAKALAWFEKAAEHGHVQAQLLCGWMYLKGQGTKVDRDKANMWLSKVAAQTEDKVSQDNAKELLRK